MQRMRSLLHLKQQPLPLPCDPPPSSPCSYPPSSLAPPLQVDQVVEFVSSNAQRLLGLESPPVLPVSSRSALRAKLEASGGVPGGGVLGSMEDEQLGTKPDWLSSGFQEFERFMLDFLVGSGGSGQQGGEGLRLKMQTPLAVADALMAACRQQLASEAAAVKQELAALMQVRNQLLRFSREVERDSEAQRQACGKAMGGVVQRAEKFVDRTLQLSNVAALSTYLLGPGGKGGQASLPVAQTWDKEVVAGGLDTLRAAGGAS
jgi:hypothetical protein